MTESLSQAVKAARFRLLTDHYYNVFGDLVTQAVEYLLIMSDSVFAEFPELRCFSWVQHWDDEKILRPVFRVNPSGVRLNEGPWDQWVFDDDAADAKAERRNEMREKIHEFLDKIPSTVMLRCFGDQWEIVMHRDRAFEKRPFPGGSRPEALSPVEREQALAALETQIENVTSLLTGLPPDDMGRLAGIAKLEHLQNDFRALSGKSHGHQAH